METYEYYGKNSFCNNQVPLICFCDGVFMTAFHTLSAASSSLDLYPPCLSQRTPM